MHPIVFIVGALALVFLTEEKDAPSLDIIDIKDCPVKKKRRGKKKKHGNNDNKKA